MISELLDRATPFSVSLNTPFRGVVKRIGFAFEGQYGFGEWAPFSDYAPNLSAKWLAAALLAADEPRNQNLRKQVACNGIVPALDPKAAVDWALKLYQDLGVKTLKVKVGDPLDVERVKAIQEALPDLNLRVDANGAWSLDQARVKIRELVDFNVSVIEQPCTTLSDCAQVRGLGADIAIDEGIRLSHQLDDTFIAQIRDAADLVVLKPIPLGGLQQTKVIAKRINLPVIISGSLDTSIGLSYVAYVAACMPTEPLASGLGTGILLANDLTNQTLLPRNGFIEISNTQVSQSLLENARSRVSKSEQADLIERLTQTVAELANQSEL